MPRPKLSVIIPTHRRATILRECLRRIERQSIADQLEVIVVSDGHDEETAKIFEIPHPTSQIPIQFFEIEKSQQGVARNRAAERASADVCLLIGDDIFLEPDACEVHLKAHARKQSDDMINSQSPTINDAVLGFTTWDPALEITPVMRWLEQTGWQFGYPKIARYAHQRIEPDRQHLFTYTSNLSIPTDVLRTFRFREDVNMYGWEDIEWGMRLRDAGIPLLYEPDARALHHHHLSLEASLDRMRTLGESAARFEKFFPHLQRVPKGWKLAGYKLAALLPTMRGMHAKAFLDGVELARTKRL